MPTTAGTARKMTMHKFFENKMNWLILMACSMWLDGMTTAYNLTHGRTENNPWLAYWFSTTPLGFILAVIPVGLVMYFFARQWKDKYNPWDTDRYYVYLAWMILVGLAAVSWVFNLIKVGAI